MFGHEEMEKEGVQKRCHRRPILERSRFVLNRAGSRSFSGVRGIQAAVGQRGGGRALAIPLYARGHARAMTCAIDRPDVNSTTKGQHETVGDRLCAVQCLAGNPVYGS